MASASAAIALMASSPPVLAAEAAPQHRARASPSGYDVSYPQCGSRLPAGGAFGIVGVTDGLPWSQNPCLATEYAWAAARPRPSFYMNTADPGPVSSHWGFPGPRACADPTSSSDAGCAYDYGWNAAADAFGAASRTASPSAAAGAAWWLDVELANSWNGGAAANAADLEGSVDYLRGVGVASVGVYSTAAQWRQLTAGYRFPGSPAVLSWVAGATSLRGAVRACAAPSSAFTGGPVALAQYPSSAFDADYPC
ncbi:MAG: hypothetical protein ACREPI_00400 [Candidatus Dormibacterales bacterium]